MVDDWTVNYRPDLLTFVPYEWSFNIVLRDFEMVWLGNQHNWIECASNKQENGVLFKNFLYSFIIPRDFKERETTAIRYCKVSLFFFFL